VRIRLTQIDGALPNLALMKLAHWHKARGDEVTVTRRLERDIFEGAYDRVYGSAIFSFSEERVARFRAEWPGAIVGGTGIVGSTDTVEGLIGVESYEHYDYAGWPDFEESIGFTQRGCRLKCKFCVVPQKEGKNRSVNAIADIWRGEGHPRKLHILDNDFFGQPREQWRARIAEIRDGAFRVCLSQGVNVRLIDDEACEALASIEYRNTRFNERRLYTAWDNLRDERVFFTGVERLRARRHPRQAPDGLHARRVRPARNVGPHLAPLQRDGRAGVEPYPMVYERRRRPDLRAFQRWVITGLYRAVPFEEYEVSMKRAPATEGEQLELAA
jgi:hypothetical protein